jgi:hypothetical protein
MTKKKLSVSDERKNGTSQEPFVQLRIKMMNKTSGLRQNQW